MYGIVNHGPNRYELQADHRRVAVVDDWNEAHKLAAVDDLLDAAKLSKRGDVNILLVAADELQRVGKMEYAIQLREKAWAEMAAVKLAEGK